MHANNAKSVKAKKRSFRIETLLDEAPAKFIIRKPILVITKMTPKAEVIPQEKKIKPEVRGQGHTIGPRNPAIAARILKHITHFL